MEKNKIKKIYSQYLSKYSIKCSEEETKEVLEKVKNNEKIDEEYTVINKEYGPEVWKNEEVNETLEELDARIKVDIASNIKIIKNCILFFTIDVIITTLFAIIMFII